ncbi:MAG: DUF4954 family protein [Gemmataceae bacterium]
MTAGSVDVIGRVRQASAQSALVRAVANLRADGGLTLALGNTPVRPVRHDEIARLERQGNACPDWSRLRVADGFDPARIQQSTFRGDVVLGLLKQDVAPEEGVELPSGIYRSTVSNAIIGHDALVADVKLLHEYVLAASALVFDCGSLLGGDTTFGNGALLAVGVETGGREIPIYAEIDLEVADLVARSRHLEVWTTFRAAVNDYAERVRAGRGLVAPGAVIRHTRKVARSYIGAGAVIDGATQVEDCTLLSSPDEPVRIGPGSCVLHALLQWGSSATTQALIENAVLMEHAHVERQGKVFASLVGPNTGVAEGEVTASLLGPFVGFHHQALLIAAVWPEGKGNVAYGANVGSNHTSRAPDQEFWPGEGAYLGLGVNIKYPSDFRRAPHTIVAMGVSTLPQKLEFPFSLVNQPWSAQPGVSPAYNEIIPAWVLTDNLYMLRRNEGKFRARNRARRTPFDFSVFRPDTVELVRSACRKLAAVSPGPACYTETELPGLGKNFMKAEYRQPAIDAYRFHVKHFALLGLFEQVQACLQAGRRQDIDRLLAQPSTDTNWEYRRRLLNDDFELVEVAAALAPLPAMIEELARDVERSKAKDDERGRRILEDYADTHVPAERDAFVQQTWAEARTAAAAVAQTLKQLR